MLSSGHDMATALLEFTTAVVACTRPREDQARKCSSTVAHRMVSLPAKELLASGEGEAYFLGSVTTCRLLMLHQMALHPDAWGGGYMN